MADSAGPGLANKSTLLRAAEPVATGQPVPTTAALPALPPSWLSRQPGHQRSWWPNHLRHAVGRRCRLRSRPGGAAPVPAASWPGSSACCWHPLWAGLPLARHPVASSARPWRTHAGAAWARRGHLPRLLQPARAGGTAWLIGPPAESQWPTPPPAFPSVQPGELGQGCVGSSGASWP